MLSTFPSLLTFGLIAPLLLRVTVGVLRFLAGWTRYKSEYKWLSIFYFASSILLIIGLYTQIAALVSLVLVVFDYWGRNRTGTITPHEKIITILLKVILISLLFNGPGFLAFDLPL